MLHRLVRRFHDTRTETIWLTIYADLITNLALVFLALYGLTIMGQDALTKAIHSMKLEEIYKVENPDQSLVFEDVVLVLKDKIPQRPDLTISENAGVVRIEFGEAILFESGFDAPKDAARPLLKEVAQIFKDIPHTIVVEGHTDSVPLAEGSRYQDNWELSLARAMSVVRLFIDEHGIPADQLAAAAYGEHRPRSSNLTALGRRINRRVEIALFKDFPYKPKS